MNSHDDIIDDCFSNSRLRVTVVAGSSRDGSRRIAKFVAISSTIPVGRISKPFSNAKRKSKMLWSKWMTTRGVPPIKSPRYLVAVIVPICQISIDHQIPTLPAFTCLNNNKPRVSMDSILPPTRPMFRKSPWSHRNDSYRMHNNRPLSNRVVQNNGPPQIVH